MDKLFSQRKDVLNGRVDIMNIKPENQWPLFQQNNTGAKNYKEEALRGIQTKSLLCKAYKLLVVQ